jgi:hypothetical protein
MDWHLADEVFRQQAAWAERKQPVRTAAESNKQHTGKRRVGDQIEKKLPSSNSYPVNGWIFSVRDSPELRFQEGERKLKGLTYLAVLCRVSAADVELL